MKEKWICGYCGDKIKIVSDGDNVCCGNHPVKCYAKKVEVQE